MNATLARLREMICYDSELGLLTWKKSPRRSNIPAGTPCGSLDRYGYAYIHLDGRNLLSHRVAWALHYGQAPDQEIDHINGLKADNRICNLRLATAVENAANKSMTVKNTSGHKGVTKHSGGKWQAQLQHNGKNHYLGLFSDVTQAAAAYNAKARDLHGDFINSGVAP